MALPHMEQAHIDLCRVARAQGWFGQDIQKVEGADDTKFERLSFLEKRLVKKDDKWCIVEDDLEYWIDENSAIWEIFKILQDNSQVLSLQNMLDIIYWTGRADGEMAVGSMSQDGISIYGILKLRKCMTYVKCNYASAGLM